MNVNWRKTAKYSAIALGALVLLLVLVVTFMDWNLFKGPIQRVASAHLGRQVTIAGPLEAKIWSKIPSVSVSGLRVGNPPWEKRAYFMQIERLQIQLDLQSLLHAHVVLRRIALLHPEIYLHREKSGRANWTFENTAPSNQRESGPAKLPAVKNAVIDGGKLILLDDLRLMDITGTVDARESAAAGATKPFHIEGRGTLNKEPFQLDVSGGPLLAISPDHPYPFTLTMRAGQHDIDVEGKVLKPFDLGGLDLQASVHGRDLAELYYLTQLALPNSPPYQVQAHIVRRGQRFNVGDIRGRLGQSDISGSVDVDATRKRPSIVAKLVSQHLYLKDLGALTGSRAGGTTSADAKAHGGAKVSKQVAANDNSRLFPDAHLQVERVQGMDADVTFTARAISSGPVPFTSASVAATLKNGVLTVHPARFDMPQGRLSSVASLDTRVRPPNVHVDLRALNIQLDQVKSKAPNAQAPLGGIFDARAIISGRGDSVRSVMASANGTMTGVIPHGDVRAAFAELTGVDVAAGIGLLLKKPDDRAAIRCGLVQFDIDGGTARADSLVMDTQNVLITGGGNVDLGSEKLDLSVQGHPKKFRMVRIKAPVKIGGHMLKPHFELKTSDLVKQGGIAAALGTVLTPVAALLAFVDPGLAKDQNCAQLDKVQGSKSADDKSSGAPAHETPKRVADSAASGR